VTRFNTIVIGAGLTGTAAARHLSLETSAVALIGPPEPSHRAEHKGVFGSHYDESRIVRTLDCDPHWGLLAKRSISRFEALQADSGISFYVACGHLALAEDDATAPENYVNQVDTVSQELGVAHESLHYEDLRSRFPFLALPEGTAGRFQRRIGGYISPRALVRAQAEIAARQGVERILETARLVRSNGTGVRVETREGTVCQADRVLVAAGAFCNYPELLPLSLNLSFMGRTVLFLEPDSAGIRELAGMPSIIDRSGPPGTRSYILPPCRYPNGRTYLKIGTSLEVEDRLATADEVGAWYRSAGNTAIAARLRGIVRTRYPGIAFVSEKTEPCVNYTSAATLPYVGCVPGETKIFVIAGGNGGTAKSSDEYGHIAARLMLDGKWQYDLGEALFAPKARPSGSAVR
jgi:sarcosine oxidase